MPALKTDSTTPQLFNTIMVKANMNNMTYEFLIVSFICFTNFKDYTNLNERMNSFPMHLETDKKEYISPAMG